MKEDINVKIKAPVNHDLYVQCTVIGLSFNEIENR